MDDLVELWERPAPGKYMIAGWHQWADAGSVSSGLPQYLVEHTQARRVGQIKPGSFYLFQIPGTHHLVRPVIKLEDGYPKELERRRNDFFGVGDDVDGFLIFLGHEPHRNEERYAEAFFDAVEALGVKRVAAVAGVYGPVPYDKDRNISCVYSLPRMKGELSEYSIRFSDYEGGASIGTYLADRAEWRGIEFFVLYAFVPSYDFSKSSVPVQPVAIGEDHKAFYDLMRRLNHMFDLHVDLSDLERQSKALISEWDSNIESLAGRMPELGVKDYMEEVNKEFTETPFEPLSDVWGEALGRLFDDLEE
jgi:predicted ATP-grasp superfamily ATP-dependent carboligase